MSKILDYKDVYEYHGYKDQCKQLMEESYELVEAINDWEKDGTLRNWNHIAEETADVLFLINQIMDNYLIETENVDTWVNYKRKRESQRISEGYYDKK